LYQSDKLINEELRCPNQCICGDLIQIEKNENFIDPIHKSNTLETNCTNIDSNLEFILNSVPKNTTHL
jgi:hypothetical protein